MIRLTYDVGEKHYCDYTTREIINRLAECEIMLEKIEEMNGLVNAPSEHEWCEAFKMTISTMKKYQKIEQIIRNYDTSWEFHTLRETVDKIREIREVIEDGND